ncbi:MAG TPA: LamG-like jellyroll fold domain-containing protein [Candidatus Polarisedimenticolaceae bacterium]|nr:LamG-like jellyroll fold domain-containing protein [Candidatus Polarisedimenticolaceae bacterium]
MSLRFGRWCSCSTLAFTAATASAPAAIAPGGFLESQDSQVVRPTPTSSLVSFMPARGPFTFPAPYLTRGARLTAAEDCAGGGDCVLPVGYSYWRNINNHVGSNSLLIFLGLSTQRGGSGPTLFRYDKLTEQVTNLGPLFDANHPLHAASAETWYFSATRPNALYLNDGAKLERYDVSTRQLETVFDAATQFGPGHFIWQMHSSDDDRVHSATLRQSATSQMLGCLVYKEDTAQYLWYPQQGVFDECHVDKSGRWLVILDNVDRRYGEDNRIIDLDTGEETLLLDEGGAAGHADMGYGYMVTEDNWGPLPGTTRVWKFGQPLVAGADQGRIAYHTTDWNADVGHISHTNARPGVAPENQMVCSSNATRLALPRSNEVVCYRLDGASPVLVVAPVMSDLDAPGGIDDYSKRPKGNLDVTGEYFVWTTNLGSGRLDALLVRVPGQLLLGAVPDATPPSVAITAPAGGATVAGNVTLAASAQDSVGVAGVQFRLDGATLGAEDTLPPYELGWNSTSAADGTHTLTALARDAAGNTRLSSGVAVIVHNAPDTVDAGRIAHWRLDETSGLTAGDASAHGSAGVLIDGPLWSAGNLGGALTLDGLDDLVGVPHRARLNAYPLSISAWLRTSTTTGRRGIVGKLHNGSSDGFLLLLVDGRLRALYTRNADDHVGSWPSDLLAADGVTVNDNQWHHVAFVVDAAGGRLYVDGSLRASKAWTGTPGPTTTTENVLLGYSPYGLRRYFAGALDDVRIYSRALSATEVSELAGTPQGGASAAEPQRDWTRTGGARFKRGLSAAAR